jgi:hypothetical protein
MSVPLQGFVIGVSAKTCPLPKESRNRVRFPSDDKALNPANSDFGAKIICFEK